MIRWMVSILSDYYIVQRWLQITIYAWFLRDESTVRNYWPPQEFSRMGMQSLQPAMPGNSNLREEEER